MKRILSRFTRVAGAVTLAGAMLLGPLSLQGSGADLGSFASSADGYALGITVDLSVLPAPVKAEIQTAYATLRSSLPAPARALLAKQFSFVIDQKFIETITDANNGVTKADAYLAKGVANFPTSSSSSMNKSESTETDSRMLPSADLPVLDVATGLLKTSVVKGPQVDASATLTEVGVALESLGNLLPVDLQAGFADLVTAVNDAVATANASLDAPLAEVAESVSGAVDDPAFAPVVALLPPGQAPTVDNLTTQLQNAISVPDMENALETRLASITGLSDTSRAQQTPGKILAGARAKIAAVDVLDGFLSVGVINVNSHSEAAGLPGSAKNTNSCSVADARLGAKNGVSLDGKNIYVDGTRVPVAGSAVGDVKSAVDSILSKAGLSVALCDAVKSERAEDGTSASQTMSAFRVTFAPLAPADIDSLGIVAGAPLIRVIIDPTVHTAVRAETQPAIDNRGPELPRTGAPIAATVLIGAAIVAGSVILWRRTRSA